MTATDPIILLVDDSENDALLMCMVFKRAGLVRPLQLARDGDEAIAYLQGRAPFANRNLYPMPTVMLLDLNMPGKNGFDVLAWIRSQPWLKWLRVYVLSASGRLEDIQRAYDMGATSYLIKPGNLDELLFMTKTLDAWLRINHYVPLDKCGEDTARKDLDRAGDRAAIPGDPPPAG